MIRNNSDTDIRIWTSAWPEFENNRWIVQWHSAELRITTSFGRVSDPWFYRLPAETHRWVLVTFTALWSQWVFKLTLQLLIILYIMFMYVAFYVSILKVHVVNRKFFRADKIRIHNIAKSWLLMAWRTNGSLAVSIHSTDLVLRE